MKNYTITVNGNKYDVTVEETGGGTAIPTQIATPKKDLTKNQVPVDSDSQGSIQVTAPMPGKVLSIQAKVGDTVKTGDTILVFEAMKMENSVVAPQDGTVAGITVAIGDSFEAGAVIASLK